MVYVYMCMCMCACVLACVYVCARLCVWACVRVCACMCMCVCARARTCACVGQRASLGIFFRSTTYFSWDRVSPWPGAHQWGETGWPVSPQWSSCLCLSVLESQVHAATSTFCYMGSGDWMQVLVLTRQVLSHLSLLLSFRNWMNFIRLLLNV